MSLPVPLPVVAVGLLGCVAAAGGVAYWYLTRAPADGDSDATPDDEGEGDAAPDLATVLATVQGVGAGLAFAIYGTDRKRRAWRLAGALVAVAAVLGGFVATAWLGWGALAGGLFVVGLVVGAAAPPVAILMFREAVPNIVGTGLAIAAQVAFNKAGLVRRQDGQYEWGALREDSGGKYVALTNGGRIDVDADDGELFSFGFGKLATSEAHGSNLDRFRASEGEGDERRAGIPVETPTRERENTILVSLAKIQRVVRGSASSELVRRGRDKALDKVGGQNQLSQLWMTAFASVLLVVGFAMTAGVLFIT